MFTNLVISFMQVLLKLFIKKHIFLDAAEDKAKYFYLLGKMYNCCSKFRTKALDALCKSVKLDPDAIEAWNELGECYWYHVNIEMARQCFERALDKVNLFLLFLKFS